MKVISGMGESGQKAVRANEGCVAWASVFPVTYLAAPKPMPELCAGFRKLLIFITGEKVVFSDGVRYL